MQQGCAQSKTLLCHFYCNMRWHRKGHSITQSLPMLTPSKDHWRRWFIRSFLSIWRKAAMPFRRLAGVQKEWSSMECHTNLGDRTWQYFDAVVLHLASPYWFNTSLPEAFTMVVALYVIWILNGTVMELSSWSHVRYFWRKTELWIEPE